MSNHASNNPMPKRKPYQKPFAKLIFADDHTSIEKYESVIRETNSYQAEKKVPESKTPIP